MLTFELNPIDCVEGEELQIQCSLYSEGVKVKWFKNDLEIEKNEKISQNGRTHTMTFEHAELNDSGQYSIVAGNVRKQITVRVNAMFTSELNPIECVEGEELQIQCSLHSEVVTVKWFKDDLEIEKNEKISKNDRTHTMTFEHAELNDSGQYCIVAGNVRKQITVTVNGLPEAIKRLHKKDKKKYIKLMQSAETEKRYFVRIMIVGKESVGKTCLLRRLLKESIDCVKSTDGVDIVARQCKIDIKDGKWIIDKEISDDKIDQIQRGMIQRQSKKKVKSNENESSETFKKHMSAEVLKIFKTKSNAVSNNNSTYISRPDRNQNNKSQKVSSVVSNLKPSATKADPTGKMNIGRQDLVGTSTNDTAVDTKTLDYKPEGKLKDNENNFSNFRNDKKFTSKENEDNRKSLILPPDLMSYMFSTSTSNNPLKQYALCGLWDFAGHKEFYATHQAFLTNNAIYLVVIDMTEDIFMDGTKKIFADFKHVGDYVDFWFDSIHCNKTDEPSANEQFNTNIDPPVFIVFTRKDEYEKENHGTEALEKRKQELQNQIDIILGKQRKYHHLRKIFWLSNITDSDEEYEKLQLQILKAAMKMKNWGQNMPLKWIILEHLIEINKKDGHNCITFSDMLNLAKHRDIHIQDIEEVLLFLRFQHEEGHIIFFEDMRDFIILNPKWLVDAFRCLVSDKNFDDLQHCTDLPVFRHNGNISDWLITERFKSKQLGSQFFEQKESLLAVMEKFDILLKLDDKGSYLMPSMMTSVSFDEVCKKIGIGQANCKRSSWLCLKFSFLPPAFFNHFSLWFIRQYIVDNDTHSLEVSRGICVLDIDKSKCEKLLITISADTIAIQLLSFSTRKIEYGMICSHIRRDLIKEIEALKQRYKLRIVYEMHFKCKTGHFSQNTKSYQELKSFPEYYCSQHKRSHQSKNIILPWMMNADEEEAKQYIEKNEVILKNPMDVFRRPLKNMTVMEGLDVTFECEAKKPSSVVWYKDGMEINPAPNIKIEALQSRFHKLTILQTTLENTGIYQIKINNAISGAILIVKEIPDDLKRMSEHDRRICIEAVKISIELRCHYCKHTAVTRCYECNNILCGKCYRMHDKLTKTKYHTMQRIKDKILLKDTFKVYDKTVDIKTLPGGLIVIALLSDTKLLTYSVNDKNHDKISIGGKPCSIAILDRSSVVLLLAHTYEMVDSIEIVNVRKRQVIKHVDVALSILWVFAQFRFRPMVYIDDKLYITTCSGIIVTDMSGTIDRQISLEFLARDMFYDAKSAHFYCIHESGRKLICINRDGNIILTIPDLGLINATRVIVNNEGYILILCVENYYNIKNFIVYKISPDVMSYENIITVEYDDTYSFGGGLPSICFEEESDSLVIGLENRVFCFEDE